MDREDRVGTNATAKLGLGEEVALIFGLSTPYASMDDILARK